jgi:hypothetical protein
MILFPYIVDIVVMICFLKLNVGGVSDRVTHYLYPIDVLLTHPTTEIDISNEK